jgi:aldose 1-epimerase
MKALTLTSNMAYSEIESYLKGVLQNMQAKQTVFDTLNGEDINQYSLTNTNGVTLSCLSYGANWYELKVPTTNGDQNLILNFPKINDYVTTNPYLNMSIGRTAGRIGAGKFKIGEHEYKAPTNESGNTLHGGIHGFNEINWAGKIAANQIIFTHTVTSQADGFPGDLDVTITYTLTDDNRIYLDYKVVSHGETVFNPTNHAYFNLNHADQNIKNLELFLRSSQRLELGDAKIPTGKTLANTETPYDFQTTKALGTAIDGLQDIPEKGLDDVFLIDQHADNEPIAILANPDENLRVKIFSQRNAIVCFTANGFGADQPYIDKTGQPYVGVALESQITPNAIFDPTYGDLTLHDGETKHYQTHYLVEF